MSRSQITKGRPEQDVAPISERQLGELLRAYDRTGALPAAEAALDLAYAQGYRRGLEEGRGDQLESMRTLLMRVLEVKTSAIDEETCERIELADLRTLEAWLVQLIETGEPRAVGT